MRWAIKLSETNPFSENIYDFVENGYRHKRKGRPFDCQGQF